jgi:undecaprenyl-diphosphatase
MLETIRAIVLGVVQGLTEFLPVSSSGHLEIAKFILRDESVGEASLLMTVVLHIATALSTIVVFRREIGEILKGLLRFRWNEEWQFALKIVLSMIPAVVIALTLEKQLESLFSQNMILVGGMLLITGTLLMLADRARSTFKNVGWLDALAIGIAQAIALLPGISRSGATISTSVLLGIDREKAARFSFLMVVPLILGYIPKKLLSSEFRQSGLDDVQWLPLLAGFAAAFISGYFACRWMIELVKKAKLTYFSIYCYLVGLAAIGWVVFNGAQASSL